MPRKIRGKFRKKESFGGMKYSAVLAIIAIFLAMLGSIASLIGRPFEVQLSCYIAGIFWILVAIYEKMEE